VLVFTRTAGFRHDAIGAARDALRAELDRRGYEVVATEDADDLSDSTLAGFDAVAFVQTTGDVLGPDREASLERFVRAGGGWAGVHAATDTEYDWPFYGELAGARFARHPAVQPATVRIEDGSHPSTAALAPFTEAAGTFTRTDEWYDFQASPRGQVHVWPPSTRGPTTAVAWAPTTRSCGAPRSMPATPGRRASAILHRRGRTPPTWPPASTPRRDACPAAHLLPDPPATLGVNR
jgi:type 1 glutamine amidotransferase